MALGKHKLALRDYERVAKVRPNDKDAKAKFVECRKVVQQIAFNKAIAVEEKTASVSDSIDVESMPVEDKYEGPRLEGGTKVTEEFVNQLLEHYKAQKLLHRRYAFQILLDTRIYFMSQPTLVSITVNK
jgi:serine/threonine-protein phosphatase 5